MNDENENNNLNPAQGLNEGVVVTDENEDSVSLESGRPAVASAPGKILVFIVAAAIFVAIVVRALFFSGGGAPVENKVKMRPERVAAAAVRSSGLTPGELPSPPQPDAAVGSYSSQSSSSFSSSGSGPSSVPDLSKLPPPPSSSNTQGGGLMPSGVSGGASSPTLSLPGGSPTLITSPSFIPPTTTSITSPGSTAGGGSSSTGGLGVPPAPPPGLASPSLPEVKSSMPRDENAIKKINSEMIAFNGGKGASAAKSKVSPSFSGSDPNSQFAQGAIAASHQDEVFAERILGLDYTLIQGKIIHAILETAIDSDLPGTLRAIVSHDIYAEAGRAILVPKGSRLIGTYNAGVKRGQGRVFIVWTRIVRPDGITINVDSPGVDNLGRAGIAGDVDNKYFEMFSSAILTSSLDIGVAALSDALFGDQQSTTTNNNSGGSTTTSSPTSTAVQSAVDSIGAVGKAIVNNNVGLTPTITIDQGTPVNVFVNKELVFPPSVIETSRYTP